MISIFVDLRNIRLAYRLGIWREETTFIAAFVHLIRVPEILVGQRHIFIFLIRVLIPDHFSELHWKISTVCLFQLARNLVIVYGIIVCIHRHSFKRCVYIEVIKAFCIGIKDHCAIKFISYRRAWPVSFPPLHIRASGLIQIDHRLHHVLVFLRL
ncbi:hypothetical protein D3C77_478220 [compost metagenome]